MRESLGSAVTVAMNPGEDANPHTAGESSLAHQRRAAARSDTVTESSEKEGEMGAKGDRTVQQVGPQHKNDEALMAELRSARQEKKRALELLQQRDREAADETAELRRQSALSAERIEVYALRQQATLQRLAGQESLFQERESVLEAEIGNLQILLFLLYMHRERLVRTNTLAIKYKILSRSEPRGDCPQRVDSCSAAAAGRLHEQHGTGRG